MAPKPKAKAAAVHPAGKDDEAPLAPDPYMVAFAAALQAIREHKVFKGAADMNAVQGPVFDLEELRLELSKGKDKQYRCDFDLRSSSK